MFEHAMELQHGEQAKVGKKRSQHFSNEEKSGFDDVINEE